MEPSDPVTIRTERLLLRQWRDSDRDPFAALNGDPVVMEHFPALLTRAQSDALVDRIAGSITDRGWGLWACESRTSDEFIGFVGLERAGFEAHFTPAVEVGWRLAHRYWGQGFAPEAAARALEYAFEELALEEVVSFTAPVNLRSQRVMQKLGMTRDPADDFDHPLVPPGHPIRRHVLYRLSASEWQALNRPTRN